MQGFLNVRSHGSVGFLKQGGKKQKLLTALFVFIPYLLSPISYLLSSISYLLSPVSPLSPPVASVTSHPPSRESKRGVSPPFHLLLIPAGGVGGGRERPDKGARGSAPVPRPKNFEKNNRNRPARRQAKPAGQSGNRRLPNNRLPPASKFHTLLPGSHQGNRKGGASPLFIFS